MGIFCVKNTIINVEDIAEYIQKLYLMTIAAVEVCCIDKSIFSHYIKL